MLETLQRAVPMAIIPKADLFSVNQIKVKQVRGSVRPMRQHRPEPVGVSTGLSRADRKIQQPMITAMVNKRPINRVDMIRADIIKGVTIRAPTPKAAINKAVTIKTVPMPISLAGVSLTEWA
ncbi:hypothetical protein GCM10007853_19670 [Algimonas ampicilliniresistens]|uniref:Uncharacterized protein n=1 Tax=Algimonas ampicilliniresistens TaxID=1298735 RepID=A0ABQ5V9D3_9PROT|nr:hypothetical protein GCM10007853_19670 [Algimonas ampicilliniresistens]